MVAALFLPPKKPALYGIDPVSPGAPSGPLGIVQQVQQAPTGTDIGMLVGAQPAATVQQPNPESQMATNELAAMSGNRELARQRMNRPLDPTRKTRD